MPMAMTRISHVVGNLSTLPHTFQSTAHEDAHQTRVRSLVFPGTFGCTPGNTPPAWLRRDIFSLALQGDRSCHSRPTTTTTRTTASQGYLQGGQAEALFGSVLQGSQLGDLLELLLARSRGREGVEQPLEIIG